MRTITALFFVYFLPGFGVSAVFEPPARWNPLVWMVASLIVTPIALAGLGTLGIPSSTPWQTAAILVAIGAAGQAVASILSRRGLRLRLTPTTAGKRGGAAFAAALVLALGSVTVVAATRLCLFEERIPGITDDLARMSQVTAIAATGVPPRHYFYPQLPLSYYYYGVAPAGLLAQLAYPEITVGQALGAHVILLTAVVQLATTVLVFRHVARGSAGLAAVLFSTLGGSLAFWLVLARGGELTLQGWQFLLAPVYLANLLIIMPIEAAVNGPQHWEAAFSVILIVLLASGIEGPRFLRAVLLGVVLAFVLGCSAFVALVVGCSFAVWVALSVWSRAEFPSLRDAVVALVTFALLSSVWLGSFTGRDPLLSFNDADVRLLYDATAAEPASFLLAKLMAVPRFIIFLLVSCGVLPLLFIAWLAVDRRAILSEPAKTWIACVGSVFFPIAFLVKGGVANDISIRGFMTMQIGWSLGAAFLLSSARAIAWRRFLEAITWVGAAVALPAALLGAWEAISVSKTPPPLPAYVRWINRNTDLRSLVIVRSPPLFLAKPDRHLIERVRLLSPRSAQRLGPWDRQYLQGARLRDLTPSEWDLRTPAGACDEARRAWGGPFPGPLYVLDSGQSSFVRTLGRPVFNDDEASIFRLDCPDSLDLARPGHAAGDRDRASDGGA